MKNLFRSSLALILTMGLIATAGYFQPAGAAQFTLRLGHVASPASGRQKGGLELAKRVEEKTKGQLKVEVYPSGQLGENPAMLQGVQIGTIEGIIIPTLFISGFHELYNVLDLPFLFPDTDTALRFSKDAAGQSLLKSVESKGVKGLAFWAQWMNIAVANFPATSPDAFKGKKFRTMPARIVMDRFQEWGASPVPTVLGELYNALQQKVVDGASLTFTEIFDFKLHETVKYITKLDDSLLAEVILVNKKWFDGLPADVRQVLAEEAQSTADYRLAVEKTGMDERWAKVKADGKNEILDLTAAQRKVFVDHVSQTHSNFFKRVPEGKNYYEQINAFLKK
jgi:tripartite ATP-independent transporter DctP family solute receptor